MLPVRAGPRARAAGGTITSAVGLLVAGKATIQARLWRSWRRFTPLVCGIWTFVLIGLINTSAISVSIGIYGLCFLAFAIALYTQPAPATSAAGSAEARVA